METLVKYVGRPFCLIVFILGLACFLMPEFMTFIPWSWQGGFVLGVLPCGLMLILDGSIATLKASLHARFLTRE
jgi:hypothetical protein